MIRRSDDCNIFSNDTLEKIAEVIDKKENKFMYDIVDSEQKAILSKKQLQIKGYEANIESYGDKFKITASITDKINLKDAEDSGAFKKLAWGRYCFERESSIGMFKYNFDDGSIWRVMTGENGEEYLVKEIDEENEDDVIRVKTANNKGSIVNDDNVKIILAILYDINESENNELISDILDSNIKNDFYKVINAKFSDKVKNLIISNHYIQSPEYESDLNSIISTAINGKQIKTASQLENLIKKYTEQCIAVTGKVKTLFD